MQSIMDNVATISAALRLCFFAVNFFVSEEKELISLREKFFTAKKQRCKVFFGLRPKWCENTKALMRDDFK